MKKYLVIFLLLSLLPACALLGKGKPFPEDSVKKLAANIEEAVRSENRDVKLPETDEVKASSPDLMQVLRTRAARYPAYKELMDAGYGYEERGGLVAIHTSKEYRKATKSNERARHALVVLQENNDRWAMYDAILKENRMGSGKQKQLRAIFTQVRNTGMPEGWLYQDENGKVVAKGK